VSPRWIAPVGDDLELLVRWLEPILERPGLTAVPAGELHIELGESTVQAAPRFEPFSALVGPVRVDAEGIVADVIPVEPFLELRDALKLSGAFTPRVVFARAGPGYEHEPLEALASDSVVISTLVPA
jgi:hypothetical protein